MCADGLDQMLISDINSFVVTRQPVLDVSLISQLCNRISQFNVEQVCQFVPYNGASKFVGSENLIVLLECVSTPQGGSKNSLNTLVARRFCFNQKHALVFNKVMQCALRVRFLPVLHSFCAQVSSDQFALNHRILWQRI